MTSTTTASAPGRVAENREGQTEQRPAVTVTDLADGCGISAARGLQ
ncbi:hypothetical protein [Kribbella qitaiheensis]|nr:hypothetical protein [Kribbella qitaiheensis]